MGDVGYDHSAEDRARRREERRRRRAEEKEQEERELAEAEVRVTSFRSTSKAGPEIEVKLSNNQSSEEEESIGSAKAKLLRKAPTRMSQELAEGKPELNEAELKAEAIRLKREQENEERQKARMEEIRLAKEESEQRQREIEERKERRRLKQEAEERRLQQEEEERQAREAEDAKKLREEIQKRRQEAEERRRNIQNSLSYVHLVSDSILEVEKEKSMTPEEQAEHKERVLAERVPSLDISAQSSMEELKELALALQAKLVKLYGATFDLRKRKQRQEYDLKELNTRIGDMSKASPPKKPYVATIDTGLVSKIKEKGFFVEDKPVKKSFLQERNEGIAASGGVQGRLSMFQNKREQGEDQPDIKRTGRSSWKAPTYDKCCICDKNVYTLERLEVSKKVYHKQCFKCEHCKKITSLSNYALFEGKVYCKPHQRKVERESLQQGIGTRH